MKHGHPISVAPLSRAAIEKFALDIRRTLGVSDDSPVDMLRLIEFVLPKALPGFEYEYVPDHQMAGAEATTSTTEPVIRISERCYEEAMRSQRRPQFTLAHELGHLLLHCRKPFQMARGVVKPFADPEWQADTFAGAFLAPADAVRRCRSVDEIAARFAISKAAANVRAKTLGLPFATKKGAPI